MQVCFESKALYNLVSAAILLKAFQTVKSCKLSLNGDWIRIKTFTFNLRVSKKYKYLSGNSAEFDLFKCI